MGWTWLLRVRRSEFFLSMATTLAVLLLGVLEGIGIAILLSLANFVRIQWRPHSTQLGEVPGVPGYHDLERHPEGELIEGLLIVRYDAPLFFANAPDFARRLAEMVRRADRPIERVLVVGNPITDIDSTGAEVLSGVIDDMERREISFAFAGLKGPVKDRLRSYGLYDRIGDENFHPNTISGVEAHRRGSTGSNAE
jgi:MFS superfamily sulfate permease-like transporter